MNPDFKNTFREHAEHLGCDPGYLLDLARRLDLPAPDRVDDETDYATVIAPLDVHCSLRALSAIHIANFKAFGKQVQRLPLAPITLVFGPNSAGKSSLMQALLFASHVQAKGELNVKHPAKGGTVVDLGGFANIQHRKQRENSIILGFELAHHFRRADEDAKPAIWWVTLGYLFRRSDASIIRAELEIDGVIHSSIRPGTKGEFLVESNFKHPRFLRHVDAFWTETHPIEYSKFIARIRESQEFWGEFMGPIFDTFETAKVSCRGLVPDGLDIRQPTSKTVEIWVGSADKTSAIDWQSREGLTKDYGILVEAICSECSRTFDVLREAISRSLSNLGYLSSTRIQPGRDFENVTRRDVNFEVNGGASWEWLAAEHGGEATRERLNRWFAELHQRETRGLAKYQFGVSYDLNRNLAAEVIETETHNYLMEKHQEHEESRGRSRGGDDAAAEAYAFPFDHLDASEITARIMKAIEAKRRATTHRRLTIHDERVNTEVTTADIGVGIQFLIPVLVEMLSGGHALKIIEEPELHAHPALQAELGDTLIEGALANGRATHSSRYLIETHSEHLILRILRRIREASEGSKRLPKIRPEDVAVIYAEPSSEGTILLHLKITEDGDFIDRWPAGFFTERADELF